MTDQSLGTTTITQVGIIVTDIEAKTKAWADILGVPIPEVMITDGFDLAKTEYKGEATQARAKLAFFNLGQVALELIESIDGPSTWKDQLDQHGDSLHHIAFVIDGMQEKVAYLNTKGITLIQRGEYAGGRYTYLDGIGPLGVILELLEND